MVFLQENYEPVAVVILTLLPEVKNKSLTELDLTIFRLTLYVQSYWALLTLFSF